MIDSVVDFFFTYLFPVLLVLSCLGSITVTGWLVWDYLRESR